MKILFWFLIFASGTLEAQTQTTTLRESGLTTFSVGLWNWTEKMTLTQGSNQDSGWANLQANSYSIGYRKDSVRWGYDLDLFFLSGKAVGSQQTGTANYSQPAVNLSGYGGRGTYYYRTEKFIELGMGIPVLFRNLTWPSNGSLQVSSGSNPLITAMAFWRFRPTKSFLIEQGIGPAGDAQSTIWNLQAEVLF